MKNPLSVLLPAAVCCLSTAAAMAQASVEFGDNSSDWAHDGECDDPRFEGDGVAQILLDEDAFHDAADCRRLFEAGDIRLADAAGSAPPGPGEPGELTGSDRTLPSGEFVDDYSFDTRGGERAVVDLRSNAFDPYLIVLAPDGEQFDNDDFEGDVTRSQVAINLTQAGTYSVRVTSYEPGEIGAYSLAMEVGTGSGSATSEMGSLGRGDATLSSGEYFDTYEVVAEPGERISIDLRSNHFDTYLILRIPDGEQTENDDGESTNHSHIDHDVTQAGTYQIIVTSYEAGEAGDYDLTIDRGAAEALSVSPPETYLALDLGRTATGSLDAEDGELDTGEYRDIYVFDAQAGEEVSIDLRSSDFDTYLAVVLPSEEVYENDDHDGDTSHSRVQMSLPETGQYRVIATSYEPGEYGAYELSMNGMSASLSSSASTRTSGRTFGVFAGISDYPGTGSDLAYTADDAVRLRNAFMGSTNMADSDQFTLLDGAATRDAIYSSIRSIAERAAPEDTFVFFFSGHGNRVPRSGPVSTDPDARDETIELYDGAITDDELSALFDELNVRTALVFLDSCFSGGFAKDLISVPGRMGLFSSEEDVTSNVAAKFRAGGFLSLFLADAISQKLADLDGDNAVSAIELSQYVYERYRADVKSAGSEDFVRTGGPQSGYQHLVVDRGSIGPYDILFR